MITVTVAPGATFRKCCTVYSEGETVDVHPWVAERNKWIGVFVL